MNSRGGSKVRNVPQHGRETKTAADVDGRHITGLRNGKAGRKGELRGMRERGSDADRGCRRWEPRRSANGAGPPSVAANRQVQRKEMQKPKESWGKEKKGEESEKNIEEGRQAGRQAGRRGQGQGRGGAGQGRAGRAGEARVGERERRGRGAGSGEGISPACEKQLRARRRRVDSLAREERREGAGRGPIEWTGSRTHHTSTSFACVCSSRKGGLERLLVRGIGPS
ncbi:hypothetical protein MARPO_0074s0002 [Marchantia polymorpha]|uniref:Uncharacterized protein n=1 Tax=Marchantia polymorpha TaxID=3197 RepID=A0A2R6WMC2_MARPO|nr:hypothetical protein MARPO_0074s0002 [Marchantia polymorpha]|eukprot:PTQ35004.1 hypothetical protein MARPO_0074s0002 [Marchantia polymorpha]